MKKTVYIADIRTSSRDGKMYGHYVPIARNYQQIFVGHPIKVAGGSAYKNYFSEEELCELPYNVPTTSIMDKMRSFANAITLFRKAKGQIIVLQQSTAITSFIAIMLFYWWTSKLYIIQYNTEAMSKPLYRLLYAFAKYKINGFICPNETVVKTFGRPACIVTDFIYCDQGNGINPKPLAERTYDVSILGSLASDKGVMEAARAFAGKPYKMLIAGRPGDIDAEELKRIAAEGGNIDLRLGFVEDDDYVAYMRNSKFCLLNYRGTYEDRSSGIVLDILFNGTPVLGNKVKALDFVAQQQLGVLTSDMNDVDPNIFTDEIAYNQMLKNINGYLKQQEEHRKKLVNFVLAK